MLWKLLPSNKITEVTILPLRCKPFIVQLQYLLFILVLLTSCKKTFENATEGNYQYNFASKKFKELSHTNVQITDIPKGSATARIKYFPQDYFVPLSASTANGIDYICIPAKEGLLTVDGNDSIRFLHPYNSFLSRMESIFNVLQAGKDTWFQGLDAVYRTSGGDTIKYFFGGSVNVKGIHLSKTGVWVVADELYLIRDKATIQIQVPDDILKWFSEGDGNMIGFSKTGKYVVNEDSMTFKAKVANEWFPDLVQNFRLMRKYFVYKGDLYIADPIRGKMYSLSDEGDHSTDFPFSQVAGISSTGELWSVGYQDDYLLQYADNDWAERLKKGQPIRSHFLVELPDYDETTGISYVRDNNDVVLMGSNMGVAVFRKDSLMRIKTRDCSSMKSFLEFESMSDDRFLKGIHNEMWYKYLLSKPTLTRNGIRLNLFHTANDTDGVHWIADNGKLIGDKNLYQPMGEYDIGRELKKDGFDLRESLENRSMLLGSRVFVNKNAVIHIFGRQSLITFNKRTNDWKLYNVSYSNSEQISYSMIYEDKDGNLWFEVERQGIYLFNGEKAQLMIPLPDPDFWQIDKERRLSFVKDGLLSLIDMNDMVANYYPVIITHKIDKRLYNLNIMSAVVWHDNKPAVVNSNGFFFWE